MASVTLLWWVGLTCCSSPTLRCSSWNWACWVLRGHADPLTHQVNLSCLSCPVSLPTWIHSITLKTKGVCGRSVCSTTACRLPRANPAGAYWRLCFLEFESSITANLQFLCDFYIYSWYWTGLWWSICLNVDGWSLNSESLRVWWALTTLFLSCLESWGCLQRLPDCFMFLLHVQVQL